MEVSPVHGSWRSLAASHVHSTRAAPAAGTPLAHTRLQGMLTGAPVLCIWGVILDLIDYSRGSRPTMPICTGDHTSMLAGALWSADTFVKDMSSKDESDLVGCQRWMMSRGDEHGKLSRQRFAKRARRMLLASAILAQNSTFGISQFLGHL